MSQSRPQNHPTTLPHAPSICRIAVAQICLNAGYTASQPAALRALTDIAARYITLLATKAASEANSRGRTQSNIFDLAISLDGASDVFCPVLSSQALRELRAFVAEVDEIPFAQPIGREMATEGDRKQAPSFAQVGKRPRKVNVPRWLPWFGEEEIGSVESVEEIGRRAVVEEVKGRDMERERERVRFRFGSKGDWKRRRR